MRIGDTIFIPGLGAEEDEQALQQIKSYYPECKVLQIEASEVVEKGGALNCIIGISKRNYNAYVRQ